MRKFLISVAFVMFGVTSAQASFVANGSFELSTVPNAPGREADMVHGATDINNWVVYSTVAGPGFPVSLLEAPFFGIVPSDGNRWLDLTGIVDAANGPFGGVRQSINLDVGNTYRVSFDIGICNGFTCANGTNVGSAVSVLARIGSTTLTATNSDSREGNRWKTFEFYYTATTATTLLSFEGSSNTATNKWYIGLDNVDVTLSPEPASFVLFGIGAAGLLAFARKRGSSR
ncbi:MAG: DUF642 domain-containing protein [Candidatus Solibacter sp.]|nr:DUF642 domain-containing protein [Candidatus Solibacter sp.]